MVLAVAGGHLGAEARAVAGQAVVLVVAVTILIVAVFTTNTSGIWGGVVLGATGFLSRLDAESLLPLSKDDVCRWTLALGSWAYHHALHAQHLQWE